MRDIHYVVESIFETYKKDGECPADTFRRILLSGELTQQSLLKYRGAGKKTYRFILYFLGLQEGCSVRVHQESNT